ncbi:hypothetical protein K6U44_04290 [Vibrio parahaemolyticus]|uniref:hypothetical protein n=1 Tax=Vibrio parahaemolyticus TaxID=670 RepID=UPI001EEC08B0|nr:hypothetical protein [Vibrio parahaemolyticus]MCG6459679.1 hypothetical protein [Vibrio parahaemolyticus]
MSRNNAVKIVANNAHSTGYHFKSNEDESSYVIASKHGICKQTGSCDLYLRNVENCCRNCQVEITPDDINLTSKKYAEITPKKVYVFPTADLAIIGVDELSYTPLKLGQLQQPADAGYVCYGFTEDESEAGRILLGSPELDKETGICFFNIESFTTPELTEKSESYNGVSGSLVIDCNSQDIVVAYSIIVNNEKNNDISGESLYDLDFDDLYNFFNSKLFSSNKNSITVDTSLREHFEKLDCFKINDSSNMTILVPINKGFPYFNLTPIIEKISDEFGVVLGTNAKNKTLNNFSALKVIKESRKLKPVYQLFSSRIVEAVLNAPHIYSSFIEDSNYHHMHFMNSGDEIDFVVSAFGGENDLAVDIDKALESMVKNINHYAISSKLIAERAFLNMKYSHRECELLYQVLFSEEDEVVKNLSIVYCMDVQKPTKMLLEQYIISLVKEACANIKSETLELINKGLNVNLFLVPLNDKDELTELMERLLNDC